ncbi:hypothetical protein NUACC21_30300 [Scytonema sp. NUACC21]
MPQHISTQSTTNSVNPYYKGAADAYTLNLIGFFIISLPVVLLLGMTTYKRYRTVVLRRRIAFLEKMWLIDTKNNTYRQE